jgi:transposase
MPVGRNIGRIFLLCQAVDMRKSWNGLIALTEHELKEKPLSGDLFVFVSRNRRLIKALFWDRTGFCIISKKLERSQVRINGVGKKELSKELFLLLFDGINP